MSSWERSVDQLATKHKLKRHYVSSLCKAIQQMPLIVLAGWSAFDWHTCLVVECNHSIQSLAAHGFCQHQDLVRKFAAKQRSGGLASGTGHFAEPTICSAGRSLVFSWTFDFVIDDFSRFRKRIGRCWAWVCSGKLQPVLIVYGLDEADLARVIEPMKIINLRFEDHGSALGAVHPSTVRVAGNFGSQRIAL
jgi:hypothetical protein